MDNVKLSSLDDHVTFENGSDVHFVSCSLNLNYICQIKITLKCRINEHLQKVFNKEIAMPLTASQC